MRLINLPLCLQLPFSKDTFRRSQKINIFSSQFICNRHRDEAETPMSVFVKKCLSWQIPLIALISLVLESISWHLEQIVNFSKRNQAYGYLNHATKVLPGSEEACVALSQAVHGLFSVFTWVFVWGCLPSLYNKECEVPLSPLQAISRPRGQQ